MNGVKRWQNDPMKDGKRWTVFKNKKMKKWKEVLRSREKKIRKKSPSKDRLRRSLADVLDEGTPIGLSAQTCPPHKGIHLHAYNKDGGE